MVTPAEERFDRLFRDNYPDVLAYARRRCPTPSDAEDVVAETFAVAWRRIDELPEGESARLWLFGTARLVRMNSHRSQRRTQGLYQRLRARYRPETRLAADFGVGERDRIQQALDTLAPIDREVLQLHVWEELSAQEIAVSLELNPPTVRKRLQRARERLAEALLEDPPGLDFARPHQEAAR